MICHDRIKVSSYDTEGTWGASRIATLELNRSANFRYEQANPKQPERVAGCRPKPEGEKVGTPSANG